VADSLAPAHVVVPCDTTGRSAETVVLNGCRFDIGRLDPLSAPTAELTALLHAAYKPLADMGLRFYASHQDEADTRAQLRTGISFVATADERLVGTILYYTQPIDGAPAVYHRPDVAVVGKFAVLPAYQRYGLGSYLLSVAESLARTDGKTRVVLDTSAQAAHLIAFYERRGYTIVGTWDRGLTNYTSVVMSKSL
jgi:GNAT superfamily N-acetyltransferase